jgi:hypothetical protein
VKKLFGSHQFWVGFAAAYLLAVALPPSKLFKKKGGGQ